MSAIGLGEKIIMSSASHRSVNTGLILPRMIPVDLEPNYHSEKDHSLAVRVEAVTRFLDEYPDAVAVHITAPSYKSMLSDVASVLDLTRKRRSPLIVDDAHGSQLHLHEEQLMIAVSIGVDLIIHSTNKTNMTLSQTSMLHVKDNDNGCLLCRVHHRVRLFSRHSYFRFWSEKTNHSCQWSWLH